jgi:hypothetical protein
MKSPGTPLELPMAPSFRKPGLMLRMLAIAGISHVSMGAGTPNQPAPQTMAGAGLSEYTHSLGAHVAPNYTRSMESGASVPLAVAERHLEEGNNQQYRIFHVLSH